MTPELGAKAAPIGLRLERPARTVNNGRLADASKLDEPRRSVEKFRFKLRIMQAEGEKTCS
ncbi:hypothetical protein [Allomesorhizobium camelthorni]|uniref:Uncharacterized protein n=1 Tax=Allomesorhizobium camelthorni TaxID=475069 RepID=A0A6G4WD75_9HYPH|nr:hypothetical protein [Mesorhizobium camelthorni]NGO52090.1 hypothetical protein [Mesorhizobium camelthorni]